MEKAKKMKYYFPLHYDGGNRGCEAIAKGTALLLGEEAQNLMAYCRNPQLDHNLGIDQYMTLIPYHRESYFVDRILAVFNRLFHNNNTLRWRLLYAYRSFIKQITPNDVMLSTGGDMMCYENNEIIYTNDYLHARGTKTVLWGCSMGKDNLTPEKRTTLNNFSLIYARESLTYDFFKSLGLNNVCLLPDPAFVLEPEKCHLPPCFDTQTVIGINLSSYVLGGTDLNTTFGQKVKKMIDYLLTQTQMHILLIPHVTWKLGNENQDDREIAANIAQMYHCDRISVLDINDLNYCNIRYVISRCSLFIGARTHAVISAYATCTPAIALGYSIKSKGIAQDLYLNEKLVVNCKNISSDELILSLDYLLEHEQDIRHKLESTIPGYKQQTYKIKDYLKKFNII